MAYLQAPEPTQPSPSEATGVANHAETPAKPDFEAVVASLPVAKTMGDVFTLGRKHLGYRATADMLRVIGQVIDPAIAMGLLVKASPLQPIDLVALAHESMIKGV